MRGFDISKPRLRCVLPFEADPARLSVLRQTVRSHLAAWGLATVAAEVQLAVTELATNVIKHVGEGAAAALVLEPMDGRLRVELHDTSRKLPTPSQPACDDEGGRGLHLLTGMALDWGTLLTSAGKAIWCEFLAGPDPNCRRVQRAAAILEQYRRASGVPAYQTGRSIILEEAATDLIADLLHWIAAQGCDPDDILDRAQMHYEAEVV